MDRREKPFEVYDNLFEILPQLDVLYMTKVDASDFESEIMYESRRHNFTVDERVLMTAKPDLVVLHGFPRGAELDVSADRAARLQHEHPAPRFREPARHRAAPEARTGDYRVKFFVRLHCAYYSILWYNVRMAQVPKTSVSLLKDLACGTESARWAEFVRMYEEPMRSFLAARFPSVEADDVLQETMIALMRVMPGYHYTPDSGGHFRNYLAGILKHKAEDAIRRRERESGRRERMRRSAADAPRDDGIAERERAAEEEWRLAAMNAALEQLLSDESVNARSREVFRHVALLHEPPAEVAAAFGISRANVDTIKRRLVLRLSELVKAMTGPL
jgi:RNA polymerase sigma factor (sigma-70 family)